MGRRLGVFASLDDVIEVADELTAIFRDNGNRQKRTRARSKFLVDEWGVERVRAELERASAARCPTRRRRPRRSRRCATTSA